MVLLDLSLVSKTLENLLENYFKVSKAWTPPGSSPTISPQPPDRLKGDKAIGIYLYHIIEDSHYKNLPPTGNNEPQVRNVPMGLNLYYILTAYSNLENEESAYLEQKMMGTAIKALHDYPIIDDASFILDNAGNKQKIFTSELRGSDKQFRIMIQSIPYSEASSFWFTKNSPPRLATYFCVSVQLG